MVIVNDDKIVDELEFNSEDPLIDYRLEDVTGTVYLRVAGESAAFSFWISETEYDAFNHQ